MQFLILGWMVLELTGSAANMGLMIFLYGMPTLGFVLFGGAFADRFGRRGLLMLTQALVAVLVLGLALLETSGLVELWHLYVASFVLGTLQAINTPARLAIVRDLVDREDLMNAVVLNSAVMNSGRILGPALAGAVIEFAGIASALYLATACFFVGTVTLFMVRRVPRLAREQPTTILADLWGGLRYCWDQPGHLHRNRHRVRLRVLRHALCPGSARLRQTGTGSGRWGGRTADERGRNRVPVGHLRHGVPGQLPA